MSIAGRLAMGSAVAALLCVASCGPRARTPAAGSADSAAAGAVVEPSARPALDLTGIWTITGHRIPGASAMTRAEAAARHGETVRLLPGQALSVGQHCDVPRYAARFEPTARFLATEYHLPPGALGGLDSVERLHVLDVTCNGASWAALGGRLLAIDADHVLAPWDGVFYELERDRDFRAVGEEPFWAVQIAKGKSMRFLSPENPDLVTPAPKPTIDRRTGTITYAAKTEATDLRVVIEWKPCTDSMSGQLFEATVTVTLNGVTYHGCGERVAKPFP